jgi:dTMP kinase
VFIDFEGIGGSGKTTLSNLVGHRLSRLGFRITHARLGGDPPTRRVAALEALTQGRSHALHPRSELFLELAEQVECLEDAIRPALRRGEICLTENYLARTRAKAIAAMGFDGQKVEPAVELAGCGIEPDVVVLLDVDPEFGRLRRQVLAHMRGQLAPRDVLQGLGHEARIREGLLELARRAPEKWIVVENEGQPLFLLEERISEAILARMEHRDAPVSRLLPPPPAASVDAPEQLEDRFFDQLDRLELREPALCARLLTGIPGLAALKRRLHFAERYPGLVALSLRGVGGAEAQRLLELVATLAPAHVAEALCGDASGWAAGMREGMFETATEAVVASLAGLDDERSWALRERALARGTHEAVLRGLAGVDSARAWRVRSAALKGTQLGAIAQSLTGLSAPEADVLRANLFAEAPLEVLESTRGVDTSKSHEVRRALLERAPAMVLRSLEGLRSEDAHAIRKKFAPRCPEAISSLRGLETPEAWGLRVANVDRWPAAVAWSLSGLTQTGEGRAMLARVLRAGEGRITVLRNAYAATACVPGPSRRTSESATWIAPSPV